MSKVNAILKQNQNKANSAKSVENVYIYEQFYLNELVFWFRF